MGILKLPGARIRVERIVAIDRVDYGDETYLLVSLDVAAFSGSAGDRLASRSFAVQPDQAEAILDEFERLAAGDVIPGPAPDPA